jgi:hypothetical protein
LYFGFSIGFSCQADNYEIPAQQQAVNVVRYFMKVPIIESILFIVLFSCGQSAQKQTDEKLIESLEAATRNKDGKLDSTQAIVVANNLKEVLAPKKYYPEWKWYYFKEGKFKTKFPTNPKTGIFSKKLGNSEIGFTVAFLTSKDYKLPINAYSVAYAKLPTYSLKQLDSLFSLVKAQIIEEYGRVTMETRVYESYKELINEYEYFIDKRNKYGRETYIRVRYSYGMFYWITINGNVGQEGIESERDFINCTRTGLD